MLEILELSTGYGNATVVHEVTLTVQPGEIVALIGANGAGKSTLVKAISGLLPAQAGSIHFDGLRIDGLTPHARVARGISQVPEGRQVFAGLTVAENLALGAFSKKGRRSPVEMAREIAKQCVQFPALASRLGDPAGNLSGGQQQMLAIARSLMSGPRLLLLDEPSLGLSPVLVAEIFPMIAALRLQGLAILLSEQNARLSLAVADRAYVLEMGRVVLEGRGDELLGNPEVAERYLGVGKAVSAWDDERQERLTARLREILSVD